MRRLLTTIFSLAIALCSMGDNVSEEQALDIAAKFFSSSTSTSSAKGGDTKFSVAKASVGYYAINRGNSNGYVIVAATDSQGSDVLGYADNGCIDTLNIPDGLRWLLSAYDHQATNKVNTVRASSYERANRASIQPLLTCNWYQYSPYNDLCPTYEGKSCLTGCGATATAQLMYYYKWPKQATGSITYDWYVNNKVYQTLSKDFSQSSYDWDNMTDNYNSSSSTASKNAVAQLMVDVGYGTEMWYGTSGSSHLPYYPGKALTNYFGYDKSLQFVTRIGTEASDLFFFVANLYYSH